MRLVTVSVLASALLSAACAQSVESIAANPVSPMMFAGYSCPQLQNEAVRISNQLAEYTGKQVQARNNDNAVVTASVILLPIAGLFAMGGPDYAPQIAQLRGEVSAIEAAARQNGCAVQSVG